MRYSAWTGLYFVKSFGSYLTRTTLQYPRVFWNTLLNTSGGLSGRSGIQSLLWFDSSLLHYTTSHREWFDQTPQQKKQEQQQVLGRKIRTTSIVPAKHPKIWIEHKKNKIIYFRQKNKRALTWGMTPNDVLNSIIAQKRCGFTHRLLDTISEIPTCP